MSRGQEDQGFNVTPASTARVGGQQPGLHETLSQTNKMDEKQTREAIVCEATVAELSSGVTQSFCLLVQRTGLDRSLQEAKI